MSGSDRFQLVAQPAIEPGEDIITRSTVGPFVDCGAWIQPSPRRRRVYLTVETIRQLAEAAGITPSSAISEERLRQERALGALDFLRENLGGDLADVARRLARLFDDADLPGRPEPVETGPGAGGQSV